MGPIDDVFEFLGEAAKALGELSEILHRYVTVNRVGVNKVGPAIDLARQGGTEVGPAEHI